MKYILVRHTKPDVPNGICYGRSDIDLCSSFELEKEAVLRNLRGTEFDMIFSSPLKRAARLAESISPKGKVHYDNRLLELDFGDWEMKSWDEIEKNQEAKSWFEDYINIPTPGGESYRNLLQRTHDFIDYTNGIKDIRSLLIVCHQGVIGAFFTILNNLEPHRAFDLKVDFGEIIVFEIPGQS